MNELKKNGHKYNTPTHKQNRFNERIERQTACWINTIHVHHEHDKLLTTNDEHI